MSKKVLFLIFLLLPGIFCSCSRTLGYSVLLWSSPEHEIADGAILKVHVKSNISHVYVVSLPGGKENFELPLWQLTEPESKSRALRQKKRFSEFERTYASVRLDGLPIRSDAVNTSKQVYRLREGEIIRCLYKGAGAAVTNGSGDMEGEWLRVLTETGTYGWCFSHNLRLFVAEGFDVHDDSRNLSVASEGTEGELRGGDGAVIRSLAAKRWYPESFGDMIRVGRIDVGRMNPNLGFSFGASSEESAGHGIAGTAVLNTESASLSWAYTDIVKIADKEYEFAGSSLKMYVRGADSGTLILQYSDKGRRRQETFVALRENVPDLIERELSRRREELRRIADAGPLFQSSNYGTIRFNDENSLTWTNFKLLQPSIIGAKAGSSVKVSLDYFMTNSLKSSYDGVITMRFSGMEDGVNFLYKLTDSGLRLEDASKAPVKDGVVTARSASPMILFFEKK